MSKMEIDKQAIEAKIAELMQEHRDLDMMIERSSFQHGQSDQLNYNLAALTIKRAKKRKLRLKDQISYLKGLLIPDIIA